MTDTKTKPGSGTVEKSESEWRAELTPMQYAGAARESDRAPVHRRV